MSMVAIIPIANILSANDLLNNVAQAPGKKSHGPNNLYSASIMPLALRRKIGGMGKLWRVERSKVVKNIADSYVCVVPVPIFCNAHDSKLVVGMSLPSIFHVTSEGHVAEIGNPVVALDSVDMVNHLNRKSSMHIQPSKAMSLKCIVGDFYYAISSGTYVSSGNDSCISESRASRNPSKNPGFWIIMKKFAQAFCGKIGVSHDAVLSLIGQRPARVDSTCWPRHFTAFKSVGVIA